MACVRTISIKISNKVRRNSGSRGFRKPFLFMYFLFSYRIGGYAKFNGLKTYNKNLKTLLAIGGWNEGSARFSKLVDDEGKRKEFVKNAVKFLRQNNFDGLDLDWEYPAFRDGSKPDDKDNYASLVKVKIIRSR